MKKKPKDLKAPTWQELERALRVVARYVVFASGARYSQYGKRAANVLATGKFEDSIIAADVLWEVEQQVVEIALQQARSANEFFQICKENAWDRPSAFNSWA